MSEYNIPVLVKWFEKRPSNWNDAGKMDKHMGTIVMCSECLGEYESQRDPVDVVGSRKSWYWKAQDVIPNPTPSQIEEEARKVGKATVTTEKREPKLYSVWDQPNNPDRYVETGEYRAPKFREWFVESGGDAFMAIADYSEGSKKFILTKYTPEAAQSAQKGTMDPKSETSTTSVIKQIKETIAAKALREAEAKAEADQVRITAIRSLVALEEEKRKAREKLRDIDDEIATLSKKWLKGVGK